MVFDLDGPHAFHLRGKVRYYSYRDLVIARVVHPLQLLVTDGKRVLFKSADGFLEEVDGQRSFAFVVNLESVKAEVESRIPQAKRKHFTMKNLEIIPANAVSLKQRR
jgi:hypothetical protein